MKTSIDIRKFQDLSRREVRKIKASDFSLGDYPISTTETMKYQGGDENYFFHGKSALNLIDSALRLLYRNKSDIRSILDFPCGHGRVLRGLRSYFQESDIYACDLDLRGIKFCSLTLGAIGVHSNENLDNVKFNTKFDLIWCGSLLTHINSDKWPKFFRFFDRILHEQGILIFTYAGSFVKELVTHGDHGFIDDIEAKRALHDYDQNGFGFMQYNTHNYEYGRTICSSLWVRTFLGNYPNYRTVLHFERGWGARQDAVVLVKEA